MSSTNNPFIGPDPHRATFIAPEAGYTIAASPGGRMRAGKRAHIMLFVGLSGLVLAVGGVILTGCLQAVGL